MPGYTENSIVVLRDTDTVFELTNDIELWTHLFTEYREATVLERDGNSVTFRLTTHPEDGRPARTWTSRRVVDRERLCADAERLPPAFPFQSMKIHWSYEPLPKAVGVVMTWRQTFQVHDDCPFSDEQMESFLNRNTRIQMQSVKRVVEAWPEGASR
jgi:aromatase